MNKKGVFNLLFFVFLLVALSEAGADKKKYLLSAIESGNVEKVRELIAQGVDVNAQYKGKLPIQEAAATLGDRYSWDPNRKREKEEGADKKRLAIVKALIDAGADVNRTDKDGHFALENSVYYGFSDIAKVLLEAGALPNMRTRYVDQTPLIMSVDPTWCRLRSYRYYDNVWYPKIISFWENATKSQDSQSDQLLSLIEHQSEEISKEALARGAVLDKDDSYLPAILIKAGADLGLRDRMNWTAAHYAAIFFKFDELAFLLSIDKTLAEEISKDVNDIIGKARSLFQDARPLKQQVHPSRLGEIGFINAWEFPTNTGVYLPDLYADTCLTGNIFIAVKFMGFGIGQRIADGLKR